VEESEVKDNITEVKENTRRENDIIRKERKSVGERKEETK
jgi:hypothetical protein